MPHIQVPPGAPGIIGPMLAFPETAKYLNALAQALLRGPSSLPPGERELIAAFVSAKNRTTFCEASHAATARILLQKDRHLVDCAIKNPADPALNPRLRALLVIADKVRVNGRDVTADDVARARATGADDQAIHDTVLISAAFCMFNRYVDGLATVAPDDGAAYEAIGQRLATGGYGTPGAAS